MFHTLSTTLIKSRPFRLRLQHLEKDVQIHPSPSIRIEHGLDFTMHVFTVSGRRWHSSFLVHHLTPLCLHVTLPHTYPSQSAPLYSLSCLWLDAAELGALCHQLDELYNTIKGLPLIYTWMDWLQTNTLR